MGCWYNIGGKEQQISIDLNRNYDRFCGISVIQEYPLPVLDLQDRIIAVIVSTEPKASFSFCIHKNSEMYIGKVTGLDRERIDYEEAVAKCSKICSLIKSTSAFRVTITFKCI